MAIRFFSLKILISQKLPDNFFSFLVYSFLRKLPMYCINMDLIESSLNAFLKGRPFWMSEIHFGSHFWPYWMPENHFPSHFWPFQIKTKLFLLEFFYNMAASAHFGCPKLTFDLISGHFRSIGHFGFSKFTFDRNSGHFRSIQN